MTAEVNVPTEAIAAGWHEFRYPRPAVDEPTGAFLRGLRAAAPLILAAELERMADTPFEDGPWWALATSLRGRAAELRGESR
jgi:hypothetical protein